MFNFLDIKIKFLLTCFHFHFTELISFRADTLHLFGTAYNEEVYLNPQLV